jgi:hypothetical protein
MQVMDMRLVPSAHLDQPVGQVLGPSADLRVDAVMYQPVGHLNPVELSHDGPVGHVDRDTPPA